MSSESVRLSVLIATKGRRTLGVAIGSAARQMENGDELLVRHDDTSWWGNESRNLMMAQSSGTHLSFMDDDDYYTPLAFKTIRDRVTQAPESVHIFRMDLGGLILWTTPEVQKGNIGTPMIVVPNVREKLGRWQPKLYEADFQFLTETLEKYDTEPLFHKEVIAVVTPHGKE